VTAHQIHDLLHRGATGADRGDVDDGYAGERVDGLGVRRGGGHGATTAFRGTEVLRSSVLAAPPRTAPRDYTIV
jgi:hypothetical protein